AAVERGLCDLDDGHRDADVGDVHRDAAAYGARADHRRLLDVLRRGVRRYVGNLRGLALGEEEIALRLGLGRVQQLDEQLALALETLIERQAHRRLDGLDDVLGGAEAARLARDGL